jgi:IS30 family transposase
MPGARLSLKEREEIALGITSGRSLTGIAQGGRPSGFDGRSAGRSSGVCGCGTPRSRSRTGCAWRIRRAHWRVSHEMIYQALDLQGRGGVKADHDRCAAHRSGSPSPQRPQSQQRRPREAASGV